MQNRQQIKRLWAKFDAEGDGYLEIDEFKVQFRAAAGPRFEDAVSAGSTRVSWGSNGS